MNLHCVLILQTETILVLNPLTKTSDNSVRFSESCISHLQSNSSGAGVGRWKCSDFREMNLVSNANITLKITGSTVNIYPESDHCSHGLATTLAWTTVMSSLVYYNKQLMASQLLTLGASATVNLERSGSCCFKPCTGPQIPLSGWDLLWPSHTLPSLTTLRPHWRLHSFMNVKNWLLFRLSFYLEHFPWLKHFTISLIFAQFFFSRSLGCLP